jgi:hypothetical protein
MTGMDPNPMAWLEKFQPGFADFSDEERGAIRDFCLLWSLYEGTMLHNSASASAIVNDVKSLKESGRLNLDPIKTPIQYFLSRYFDGEELTYAYAKLRLRRNDQTDMVERVVRRESPDEAETLSAILIIVLRLRNNLFHGMKWAYGIRDQLKNFQSANRVLMAVMEMHRHAKIDSYTYKDIRDEDGALPQRT